MTLRFFSAKDRLPHLGPYPLERLTRKTGAPSLDGTPPFSPLSFDKADDPASIINAMRETGVISEAEADRALANPAGLSREAARRTGAHFADWVMEAGPAYLTQTTAEDVVIRTTFDPALQAAAEDALAWVEQMNDQRMM